jgi:hypothetical protein
MRKDRSTELQNILEKLRARGSNKLALAALSWTTTLRQVATDRDIDQLEEDLSLIRQQRMVTLLSLLM